MVSNIGYIRYVVCSGIKTLGRWSIKKLGGLYENVSFKVGVVVWVIGERVVENNGVSVCVCVCWLFRWPRIGSHWWDWLREGVEGCVVISVGDWGSAAVVTAQVVSLVTGVLGVLLAGVAYSTERELLVGVATVVSAHAGAAVGTHIGGWYGLPVPTIDVGVVKLVSLLSLLLLTTPLSLPLKMAAAAWSQIGTHPVLVGATALNLVSL